MILYGVKIFSDRPALTFESPSAPAALPGLGFLDYYYLGFFQ